MQMTTTVAESTQPVTATELARLKALRDARVSAHLARRGTAVAPGNPPSVADPIASEETHMIALQIRRAAERRSIEA